MIEGLNQAAYVVFGLVLSAAGAITLITWLLGRWRPVLIPGVLCLLVALIPMGFLPRVIIGGIGFGLTALAVRKVEGDGPNNVELTPRTKDVCRVAGAIALGVGLLLVITNMSL